MLFRYFVSYSIFLPIIKQRSSTRRQLIRNGKSDKCAPAHPKRGGMRLPGALHAGQMLNVLKVVDTICAPDQKDASVQGIGHNLGVKLRPQQARASDELGRPSNVQKLHKVVDVVDVFSPNDNDRFRRAIFASENSARMACSRLV